MERKKKIAIVSLTMPGLPPKHGGEIRDAHIFDYLADNFDVDIFCIYDFPSDERHNKLLKKNINVYSPANLINVYPDFTYKIEKPPFLLNVAKYFDGKNLYLPIGKYPHEIKKILYDLNIYTGKFLNYKLKIEDYDFIFTSSQVIPLFISKINIPKRCCKIFATYDVEKNRYLSLIKTKSGIFSKLSFLFEWKKAKNYEKKVLNNIDGVIAVSELDKKIFINDYGVSSESVLALENGVDTEYFSPKKKYKPSLDIVFVGQMGYAPNSQAVLYFINKIFPSVLKEIPAARFFAVGGNINSPSDRTLRKYDNGKNIFITGDVPDVRPYLDQAGVVCVPLLSGSGTKNKILEALAMGKAVVTTPVGVEGLDLKDGVHLLVRESAHDIAEAVIYCLKNPEYSKNLGEKGHKFIVSTYELKNILPKMRKWMEYLYDCKKRILDRKIINNQGILPLVSVVTPSYNQAKFIEETIKSVVEQNYPNIEYIIVDGGSDDGSVEIIKSYAKKYKFIKWISEKDRGQSHAINKGFFLAKGELMAWINSDDTYFPRVISKIVDFFNKNPGCKFLYGNAMYMDEYGKKMFKYPVQSFCDDTLSKKCFICQPAAFWRREVYEKIGKIDEDLDFCIDYDYWIRISDKFHPCYIKVFLASSRMYPANKTIKFRGEAFREAAKIVKKHYKYIPMDWLLNIVDFKNTGRDRFFKSGPFSIKTKIEVAFRYLYENSFSGRHILKVGRNLLRKIF